MSVERLVIVGGSYAAQQMAASAREFGFAGDIAMISQEDQPPYQRPPLSKSFLSGKLEASRLPLVGEGFYTDNRVDLRLGQRVVSIDPLPQTVQLADATTEPYDWLALCTGARPRRLPIPGESLAQVHYLRTLSDARRLKQTLGGAAHLCVIGGGFIGLEVAAVCRQLGLRVTVLEAASALLQRALPDAIGHFLMTCHEQEGVSLRLNCSAHEITKNANGSVSVVTSRGDAIECDQVVIGIGAEPNQQLADTAGLLCTRGIVTDTLGRTSADRILAAGDCATFPNPFAADPEQPMVLESIQATRDLARAAGSLVAGKPQPYNTVPWFWSDQYNLKLQIAGLYRGGEEFVFRGDVSAQKFSVFGMHQSRVVSAFSINSPADHMMARKLIAAKMTVDTSQLEDAGFKLKTLFEK